MLTAPTHSSSLSHIQSFENTQWSPYNQSQEDVLAQAPMADEDDPWTDTDNVEDPGLLREQFYAERQMMQDQLSLAGRFGLELQQSLMQAQQAERDSYAQIQALQDENSILQSRIIHSQEHAGSEEEVQNLASENKSLQRELDGCRRELKLFREELDGLVDQMAEMGSEVTDAKNKVSVYSRRLNEVEQELNSTQEINVNLQEQLRVSLDKQKQSFSSTTQAVKNMQNELGRVVSDSGAIRSTLEVLETRQTKYEGQVVEMMTNTKEYAHMLEEAQTTIQTMRIESDMEGRGWNGGHMSPSASWDTQLKRSNGQLSTLAMEDPSLRNSEFEAVEKQNSLAWIQEQDPHIWNKEDVPAQGIPLGMELSQGPLDKGMKGAIDIKDAPNDHYRDPKQVLDLPLVASPPSTPKAQHQPQPSKQLTPAPSPQAPAVEVRSMATQTPALPPQLQATSKDGRKYSTNSIAVELQKRLEDHKASQTPVNAESRPPWNPSVALEFVPPPSTASSVRARSRSASRVHTSVSSRTGSRPVSQACQYNVGAPAVRTGRTTFNAIPSPQTSPQMATSPTSTAVIDAASAYSNKRQGASSNNLRPRSRTTAATVEKVFTPAPGLKQLLSANNSSTDLPSLPSKTKTAKATLGPSNAPKSTKATTGAAKSAPESKKSIKAGSNNSLAGARKTGGSQGNLLTFDGVGSTTPKPIPRPPPSPSNSTLSKKPSDSSLSGSPVVLSGATKSNGSLTSPSPSPPLSPETTSSPTTASINYQSKAKAVVGVIGTESGSTVSSLPLSFPA